MQFPQYRKYSDGNTYFKVVDSSNFIEHKKVGSLFTISEIECKLFPEKMFLNDLLICGFEHIEIINDEVYESEINNWKINLKQF